jgi:hypothetical protein
MQARGRQRAGANASAGDGARGRRRTRKLMLTARAGQSKDKGRRARAMARAGGGVTFELASWSARPRQFSVEKPLERSHGIVADCPYRFSDTIDGLGPINPVKQQHIRVEDAMKGGRKLTDRFCCRRT